MVLDSQAVENKTADVVKLQTMDKYIPLPVFVNTFFFGKTTTALIHLYIDCGYFHSKIAVQ